MTAATTRSLKGRPWIQTWSGRAWCADAPHEYDYRLDEIVMVLSGLPRFNAHTLFPYSVLHHSLLVAIEVAALSTNSDDLIRGALLHDAAEFVVGDMTSPLRSMRGMESYNELEHYTSECILLQHGLLGTHKHPLIKKADMILLATEKRDVLGPSPHADEWRLLPAPCTERIYEKTPADVRTAFVAMWKAFGGT